MTVRELFSKVKEILTTKGWNQGTLFSNEHTRYATQETATCYCLNGAMLAASGSYFSGEAVGWVMTDVYKEGCKYLTDFNPNWVAWNDRPGRTKEEVIELVDKILTKLPE